MFTYLSALILLTGTSETANQKEQLKKWGQLFISDEEKSADGNQDYTPLPQQQPVILMTETKGGEICHTSH